jgi:hypothetical protein
VVTVTGGDYTDIAKVWEDKDMGIMNGKNERGTVGVLEFQSVRHISKSGEGQLKMCIVEENTNNEVTVENFFWGMFEAPQTISPLRGGIDLVNEMRINAEQANSYYLWPHQQGSGIMLSCEDGNLPPCQCGVRTIFGAGNDFDDRRVTMDEKKEQAVVFNFINTSCWEFTFEIYCPADQPDYTGDKTDECRKGLLDAKLFFALNSNKVVEEIINDGERIFIIPSPATPVPRVEEVVSELQPDEDSDFDRFDVTRELSTTTDQPSWSTKIPPRDYSPELPDVALIKMDGVTSVDVTEAVTVLKQNRSTVTVRLNNIWERDSDRSTDQIFYKYPVNKWHNQKCFEEANVPGGGSYQDITIQCQDGQYTFVPFALLEICVVDGVLDEIGNDAAIPKCCHDSRVNKMLIPTVCYHITIQCDRMVTYDV